MEDPEHALMTTDPTDRTETESNKSFIDRISELGSALIGITLILYLLGFMITNLYLGAYGVVNLDLVRAKYVLTGALFVVFLATILVLFLGVLEVFIIHPAPGRYKSILKFAVASPFILCIGVQGLATLANPTTITPIGIPEISAPQPLSLWLSHAIGLAFRDSRLSFLIIVLGAALVAAFRKFSPAFNRWYEQTVRLTLQAFSELIERKIPKPIARAIGNGFRGLGKLIVIFLALWSIFLVIRLLSFLATNDVDTPIFPFPSLFGGWTRFIAAVSGITLLSVGYIILIRNIFPSLLSHVEEDRRSIIFDAFSWIYGIACLIVLFVPAYTFGIYPNLPQQIGGGKILSVKITLTDRDLEGQFNAPNAKTYILDRASGSTLFLVQSQEDYEVIEIPVDQIQSITYLHER